MKAVLQQMNRRSLCIFIALAALWLAPKQNCRASASEPTREHAVKAAFIYNFAQFTQWPADAFPSEDSPLILGIIGESSPIEAALQQAVAGKTVNRHPIAVKHLNAVSEVPSTHLLVIPGAGDAHLEEIFKQVADRPIMTVGESDFFPWSGGTIRFITEENKVRFEINPDSAEKAHLKISSKLMKLARIFKR